MTLEERRGVVNLVTSRVEHILWNDENVYESMPMLLVINVEGTFTCVDYEDMGLVKVILTPLIQDAFEIILEYEIVVGVHGNGPCPPYFNTSMREIDIWRTEDQNKIALHTAHTRL